MTSRFYVRSSKVRHASGFSADRCCMSSESCALTSKCQLLLEECGYKSWCGIGKARNILIDYWGIERVATMFCRPTPDLVLSYIPGSIVEACMVGTHSSMDYVHMRMTPLTAEAIRRLWFEVVTMRFQEAFAIFYTLQVCGQRGIARPGLCNYYPRYWLNTAVYWNAAPALIDQALLRSKGTSVVQPPRTSFLEVMTYFKHATVRLLCQRDISRRKLGWQVEGSPFRR